VLAVRSCFEALPEHESLLVFDTLFHVRVPTLNELTYQQSLPEEVYTYAFPGPEHEQKMPIRKYGFHGLSYGSILGSVAQKLGKKEEDVSIVIAHLGSGGSACCIQNGKSIDTSEKLCQANTD
jgi:acetate kinase